MLDDGRSSDIAPAIIASWEVFVQKHTRKKATHADLIRMFTNPHFSKNETKKTHVVSFDSFLQIIDNDQTLVSDQY